MSGHDHYRSTDVDPACDLCVVAETFRPLTSCRYCTLPATNGFADLCTGHQRLLGVGPAYDVRADPAPNH